MSSATATMSRKRTAPPVRSRRAIEAAERAQRNECLVRLYQQGESIALLVRVSGISEDQVLRILRDANAIAPPADSSLLTPAEKRALIRENATSPQAVSWLIEQRTDARHNGRHMPRLVTNSDAAFEDDRDD